MQYAIKLLKKSSNIARGGVATNEIKFSDEFTEKYIKCKVARKLILNCS